MTPITQKQDSIYLGYLIWLFDKIKQWVFAVLQDNPRDGKVEIAYWTFKEFEGQRIASFACKELITISHNADPKLTITAKTVPEQNASTKILENNGFIFREIVQDEEIGDVWMWTLTKKETTKRLKGYK